MFKGTRHCFISGMRSMGRALLLDNQQLLHMKPISGSQSWEAQLQFCLLRETCSVPALESHCDQLLLSSKDIKGGPSGSEGALFHGRLVNCRLLWFSPFASVPREERKSLRKMPEQDDPCPLLVYFGLIQPSITCTGGFGVREVISEL